MGIPKFTDTYFHALDLLPTQDLPKKFTFPFYYTPHKLSILASEDLQNYLINQEDFNHNFGLNPKAKGLKIGKMFGVMVVKNRNSELGYIAAFSGKLAESNYHKGFVPTVYDTLNENGFYKIGEKKLNILNSEIEHLEHSDELVKAKEDLKEFLEHYDKELSKMKSTLKKNKSLRRGKREQASKLKNESYLKTLEELKQESIKESFALKDFKREGEAKIDSLKTKLNQLTEIIDGLKEKRAKLSSSLQRKLHEQYRFLNNKGETKDLLDIFKNSDNPPPAGSGECAAPKLFQYAYENDMRPIAMAEFWWGASPKSQVRQHKQFYPSCRSKCEPILGHMMQGLNVEENPIKTVNKFNKPLEIVYEDEYLLLVNKPHEFLSVPGKHAKESVLTKIKSYLPKAKGPLLVHRLDMSTSGLILVAKNEKTHKNLQKQFINRSIKKCYVALLDGKVLKIDGEIDLPLRVDLDNRPQQLVCYDQGKPAKTKYKVIDYNGGKTRIHFYPITGRTHQLRVHAAHVNGLNTPIIGDDLYGKKEDRLFLHAEELQFLHPVTQEDLKIICKAPF